MANNIDYDTASKRDFIDYDMRRSNNTRRNDDPNMDYYCDDNNRVDGYRQKRNKPPVNARTHGAFNIDIDRIHMDVDINFAIALSEFILNAGCDNKAIMAFAHNLNKLDAE